MNTYRPAPSSNYWVTAVKILILILALYLSALILGRIFSWIFAIAFVLIKIVVFAITGFLILHFLLKVLFRFDLIRLVFGPRYRRF